MRRGSAVHRPDAPDLGPRAVPPGRLGLREERGRLADAGREGRQPRLARQSARRRRQHQLRPARPQDRPAAGTDSHPRRRGVRLRRELRQPIPTARRPRTRRSGDSPVYIAFDCMYARGRDLRHRLLVTGEPLRRRDRRCRHGVPVAAPGPQRARLLERGAAARLGRMVAKDDASRYVGGRFTVLGQGEGRPEGRFLVVGLDIADGHASSLLLVARRGRITSRTLAGSNGESPAAASSRSSAVAPDA